MADIHPIHDLEAQLEQLAWEAETDVDTQILGAAAKRVRDCERLVAAATDAEAVLSDLGAELAPTLTYMSYFGASGHGLKVLRELAEALKPFKGVQSDV